MASPGVYLCACALIPLIETIPEGQTVFQLSFLPLVGCPAARSWILTSVLLVIFELLEDTKTLYRSRASPLDPRRMHPQHPLTLPVLEGIQRVRWFYP